MRLHDEVRIYCKVRANEPRIIGSDQIDRLGRGDIGIVYQGLVLARESRTPILEARSEVWIKRRCLNKAGMDQEDYLIFCSSTLKR